MHRFSKIDYTIYSVKDFLMDQDFIDYLNSPTPVEIEFWCEWEKTNALEVQNYLEAINLHKELKAQTDEMTVGDLDSGWEDLTIKLAMLNIDDTEELVVQNNKNIQKDGSAARNDRKIKEKTNYAKYFFSLSSVILIFFSLTIFTSNHQSPINITTSNGQLARISLPDGSKVTINSNSKLSYSTKGFIFKDRVVNLDGEAFFEVSKQKLMGQKLDFTVIMKPASIQVTGTSFNVSHRNNKLNVFLQEGKIILNTPINGSIDMKEGDAASLDDKGSLTLQKNSNNNLHLAWMDNKLIFEQTPFSKIIESIESLYGVKVSCKSQTLLSKTFTGVLPADEKAILLSAIKETFNLSIIEKNDTLFISQNKR